ncbi:SAM-dependent methyltransferase [Streptomyces sp. NPDC091416]|uniref:SAM-dependent methyltransferase n=1 Tax=Streptomyces sp. NPDC091416 TaxID=3366003 RepID=UPI003823D8B3
MSPAISNHPPIVDDHRIDVRSGCLDRAMSYLTGGPMPHFPRDRALAHRLQEATPWVVTSLEINRAFLRQTAHNFAVQQGIRQFISLGARAELPWPGQPEDIQPACTAVPEASFTHLDVLPPTAVTRQSPGCHHARRTMRVGDVLAVLRRPVLQAVDRTRPVAVLIDNAGAWTSSDADLRFALNQLRAWLPPGSTLCMTHATTELAPAAEQQAALLRQNESTQTYSPRPRETIAGLLSPWALSEPGLVPTSTFYPGHRHAQLPAHHSGAYAAITLHPDNAA